VPARHRPPAARAAVPALLLAWLLGLVGPGVVAPRAAVADDLLVGRRHLEVDGGSPSASAPARPPTGRARYERPVDGPVLRPFDAPRTSFGPGHRGVDLDVPVGTAVASAAAGIVRHVGSVAGILWVAVDHGDGIVTTYGPLTGPTVGPGDRVARGETIGRLASGGHGDEGRDRGLHWGARLHGVYVDPLGLLDEGMPRPSLVGGGGWRGTDLVVEAYEPWAGGTHRGWLVTPSPDATAPGFALAPTPNHLVVVAGLGTSSRSSVIDPRHLGYAPDQVTRFSYAGRHDGPGDPDDPRRDQLPYGPEDTWEGVDAAARRLREQLLAYAAREPGRAVDLLGHSMGGVVIVHYLVHHHDAYDRRLPPISNVVTVASPLQGSDLAGSAQDIREHGWLGPFTEHGRRWVAGGDGPLAADARSVSLMAPAIDDLAPSSRTIAELAAAWDRALRLGPSGPLAMNTRVMTIGGSRDRVVGAHRTPVPDPSGPSGVAVDLREVLALDPSLAWTADGLDPFDRRRVEHRVLPGGHTDVLRTEAVREVVHRFLRGDEVPESPGRLATRVAEEVGAAHRVATLYLRAQDAIVAPLRRLLRLPPGPVARPRGG
jgi:murein DD-endopeptidase MepM/ murein hydrolase activator NlpD